MDQIKSETNCTMEQLIEENKKLKEANQILLNIVDTYDKELSDMTDMLKKTTSSLNKANKIIESVSGPEIRRVDGN